MGEKQKSGDSEEREREREREEEEERRMTSAARPTWAPAKGSEDQGGTRMFGPRSSYSSKDAPAHTKLKYREVGQEGPLAAKNTRDLKRELLQKEAKHFKIQADGLEHRIKVPGVVDAEFAATGELLA